VDLLDNSKLSQNKIDLFDREPVRLVVVRPRPAGNSAFTIVLSKRRPRKPANTVSAP
jgi:hypothetical protein